MMVGRKLTESDVISIREDRRSVSSIAHEYGVARTMISRIQLGQAWTHIPGARAPLRKHTDRGGRDNLGSGKYLRTNKNYRYSIWLNMIQRCTDPEHHAWHWYGARGITVCDRWLHSFRSFVDDMGDRPSAEHSLDRVDNNSGYSPENCRWATSSEQAKNRRPRSKRRRQVKVNGQTVLRSEA